MSFPSNVPSPAEHEQMARFRMAALRRWGEILNRLGREHRGKAVVFDLLTGEYELDDDQQEAAQRLEARLPQAIMWVERVPDYHRSNR